jgi:hypothetical protein
LAPVRAWRMIGIASLDQRKAPVRLVASTFADRECLFAAVLKVFSGLITLPWWVHRCLGLIPPLMGAIRPSLARAEAPADPMYRP